MSVDQLADVKKKTALELTSVKTEGEGQPDTTGQFWGILVYVNIFLIKKIIMLLPANSEYIEKCKDYSYADMTQK